MKLAVFLLSLCLLLVVTMGILIASERPDVWGILAGALWICVFSPSLIFALRNELHYRR